MRLSTTWIHGILMVHVYARRVPPQSLYRPTVCRHAHIRVDPGDLVCPTQHIPTRRCGLRVQLIPAVRATIGVFKPLEDAVVAEYVLALWQT